MERDSAPNRLVTTATPPTHAAASWFGAVSERVPPERPAIVFRDRRVSWGELRDRVSSVAGVLSGSGLGRPREADEVPPLGSPHDHIGLMLENGPEYIEAFLGASAARALAFNVNTRYTATETADLLRRMDARALVFSGRLAPVVAAALPLLPAPPALVLQVGDAADGDTVPGARHYEAALAAAAPLAAGATRPSSDDLVMICTGGTTGTPKGVLWASREFFVTSLRGHELLDAAAEPTAGAAIDVALAEEPPRSICTTALVHFAAQAVALQALVRGGTALVLPTDTGFSAAEFVRLVEEERATDGMLIGDTLGVPIADALAVRSHDTSSLRFLTAGSALLSVATKRRLLNEVPHLEIRDSLGASETGLQAIARATADCIEESFTLLPGNDVLDDDGKAVAPGAPEPGSLARVEHVARGYYRDEAATARVFRHGPLGRFAVTGDAVRKGPDGTITLLGREAVCINTGGEKVFAEEVERVLLAHDAVADCLVVGVPSARWGHEVRALVVGRGAAIDGAALDAHARGALAGYKVPKRYIAVGGIERLVSGKPDYRWARERATC